VRDTNDIEWGDLALECAISVAVVVVFLTSCLSIGLNPLDRLGQISGLASLGLRFSGASIVLITLLVIAARRGDDVRFERSSRYTCAAIAGLASGMVAAGCWVALHGTPWGFNAKGGDAGALAAWAEALHHGKAIPPMYPPLALHILHIYSDISGLEPGMAMKHLEIAGVGAMGPAAYLSWRLLLRPTWALGIGCLTMFPLFEPYKPFPNLVLVVFIPLAIVFLDTLRHASERDGMALVRWGIGLGVVFGILSLTYSGWFQWSAPGLFIATLIVFPWRKGRRDGLLFLGVTAVCYLLITGHYMVGLFTDPHAKIVDNYVYFDVRTDPMYVAMWRNDLPGIVGPWPPIGELGGANLFTILLGVGLGAAVALGRKTTVLTAIVPMIAGAFLMRFLYARNLWATRLVQLYPRTTPLILYGLLVLAAFAIYWWFERAPKDSRLRTPNARIGALVGILFVLGAAGSATSDRYMPVNTDPPGAGWLAWNAHQAGRVGKLKPARAKPMKWDRRPLSVPPAPPAP
jgi:galactan 5-O-arabinofuranosyltransferase